MFDFVHEGRHPRTALVRIAQAAGVIFEHTYMVVMHAEKEYPSRIILIGDGFCNWTVHTYYPKDAPPIVTLTVSTDVADEAIAYFTSYNGITPTETDARIRLARKKWEMLRKDGIFRFPE